MFKESNINNHQNIQRDNNISYENNITDFENQDTSCGICKCLGAIATLFAAMCMYFYLHKHQILH
ncbi:hypothetical protein BG75_04915 [Rickettsia endosymbiont of Proechinophthirus fluctus]|nr:hypothetical protein BG75_04915 [Rickettsia endosymbiont of Proechinophthirus fluctus]